VALENISVTAPTVSGEDSERKKQLENALNSMAASTDNNSTHLPEVVTSQSLIKPIADGYATHQSVSGDHNMPRFGGVMAAKRLATGNGVSGSRAKPG